MMSEESILCWNCHGAGSLEFLRSMREFKRSYNPAMIILLEPKISGERANEVCWKLGKPSWVRSKAEGFCGGVWLLWEVKIKPRYVNKFFVHVQVRSGGGKV